MRDPKPAAAKLKKATKLRPSLAIVLGSGFQNALSGFTAAHEISYGTLPSFPAVGVSGHEGKLLLGHFGKTPTLVLKGRAHYYEGHDMDLVTFPVRVLAEFGISTLLLTNAAGGINQKFRPGDFMVIEDHINMMGVSPLRGPGRPGLPFFVDLGKVYDAELVAVAKQAAKGVGLRLHAGVYLAVSGPNYETPAEIRAFRQLGADAVGMSTVPEAIVARQCGISVAGVSCITNVAGGDPKSAGLSHKEVLAMGESKKQDASEFLQGFVQIYAGKS